MTFRVEQSAEVNAAADVAYKILADFKHHDRITPKPPFGPITVEQGGVGAGTVIRFQTTLLGQTDDCYSVISEPEPGRVMVETETIRHTVTTFTADPSSVSSRSRVTISCVFQGRDGILGVVERWVAARLMTPVLAKEIRLLEEYARTNPVQAAPRAGV
jgi:hypothetical protein